MIQELQKFLLNGHLFWVSGIVHEVKMDILSMMVIDRLCVKT